MVQAFDLAYITDALGAPSFALFAKGGNRKGNRRLPEQVIKQVVSAMSPELA
jgi:hypothetical protein